MTKYWMAVASKNHVLQGIKESFAQTCHGKAQYLKRMKVGDRIIYYSPKLVFEENIVCQEFTAIGKVIGENIFQFDMGGGFIPFRREIQYYKAKSVPIKPLILQLSFIKDKKRWGYSFRFGFFQISVEDYQLIKSKMLK